MALGVLLAAGMACGSMHRTAFLDEGADFDAIKKVAVLPFENLTSDQYAAEKVTRIFIIELLAAKVVNVVDPGEVARVLHEQGITAVEGVGQEGIASLAKAMGAQAIILGSVQEFGVDRSSQVSAARVSFTCRMLQAETGNTLWSASVSRGGAGAMSRLFGVPGDSTTEAAQKMVREALLTLIK
ncbi:MAG: GNA1162 family protein [Acidobacteriota bacterium]